MAGECVERQQRDVDGQHQRSHSDEKAPFKPESDNGVIPEKAKNNNRRVKEIAMNVLQNKREPRFATIVPASAFAHGAGRRVKKKCPIVRLAVVVAGGAEAKRKNQDQQRRRNYVRQPVMVGIDQRRIKRRKIRAPFEKLSFESAQRSVNAKASQDDHHGKDLRPPGITAQRAAESPLHSRASALSQISPPKKTYKCNK